MRKRILCITLAITVFALFAFSLVSAQIYYNTSIKEYKNHLQVYMNAFDEKYYALDSGAAKQFSQDLDGARVTFMTFEGTVTGESSDMETDLDHSYREEVLAAIIEGEGFSVRQSKTLGKEMIYYCKKTQVQSEPVLVRIAVPTVSAWGIFAKSLPTLITYLFMDVIACLVFTYAATGYVIKPIEKLTRQAAYGGELKTEYPELKPIVRVLNERNADIERKIKEIKDEKELVVKAQKSKDEFIANITHEMNTPLTSIKGYAELLSSGMLNEEQTKVAYSTIASQSERLSNLIACVINYNEISNDELPSYEVDLSKLAKETLAVLKPEAAEKGVELIDETQDGVTVLSRHERMSELLGNLIRNAIRYNKEGGSVTVYLNYGGLSVKDTGVGISEENKDKIFSRFFTVDKSHSGKNGGFGLGLAVVKKICDKAGWTITVQSTPDEGSTFTVDFNR